MPKTYAPSYPYLKIPEDQKAFLEKNEYMYIMLPNDHVYLEIDENGRITTIETENHYLYESEDSVDFGTETGKKISI